MEAIGAVSGLITVVEVSVRITRLCLAYSRDVKNASDDIKRLEQTVLHLRSTTESVLDLLQGPDNWRLQASQKLRQAAEDSKTRLDNLEERLQPSSTRGKFMRLGLSSLKWPFQKKDMDRLITELSQCSQAISAALQVDQLNVQLQTSDDVANIGRGIRDLDRRALLDQLPVVHGAAYDSQAEEKNAVCLADTRVDYLHQIMEWANAPDAETLLWLKGMAGTGKSTISRTIARSLAARGLLGANFFFKRGESDRNNVNKLFTTLAFQLSVDNRRIAQQVVAAIKADPALPNKATRDQFDKLILQPILQGYQGYEKATLVVILDALDECENQGDARNIISLFSQSRPLPTVNLRVFVTSRPELMLRVGFNQIEGSYRSLDLSDAPTITVEQDIARYFTSELTRIRREYNVRVSEDRRLDDNWPGKTRERDLIDMAIPLFIFAATVCRFLAEIRWEPDEQLLKILSYRSLSQLSKLDATYTPVLDQLIEGLSQPEIDEVVADFHKIVGPIVLLENPLSTLALSQLLDLRKRKIDRTLDMLHSVLSIPEVPGAPVRLLHVSFRDYLLNSKLKSPHTFWIDKKVVHQAIAEGCLRVMKDLLHEDMCNLGAPGAPRASLCHKNVNESLSDELQYAVTYWTHHVSECDANSQLFATIYTFLTEHFLHWVEALSILGRLSDTFTIIAILEPVIPTHIEDSKGLKDFLLDATQFVRRFFDAIDVAPLQLYSSALIFSPQDSIIRRHSQLPDWISITPIMPVNWDPCVMILEGHKRNVHMAIMSPDMKLIAACTSGKVVWIWAADTGELQMKLEGHTDKVISIAFSQDSTKIASSSKDNTIRVWDIQTGICSHNENFPFSRTVPTPQPTLFLQDATLVARAQHKDGFFRIWNIETGEDIEKVTIDGEVALLNTSKKTTTMLSSSDGLTLKLWRTDSPDWSHQFGGNGRQPKMFALSVDSTLVAVHFEKIIQIWQTKPLRLIKDIDGCDATIWKMSFSPDLKLLVTGSDDCIIRIWKVETGECIRTIWSHLYELSSLEFSPDSLLIISASGDGTVRIWEAYNRENWPHECMDLQVWSVEDGTLVHKITVDDDNIDDIAIAGSSDTVAVAYASKNIRIWSLDTGKCIHEFTEGQSGKRISMAFDWDKKRLACSFRDNKIQIWAVDLGICISTINTPGPMLIASFNYDGSLRTRKDKELTYFTLKDGASTLLPATDHKSKVTEYEIDDARRWIKWNGSNLLRLPLQYFWYAPFLSQKRKDGFTVITFGSETGQLLITKVDNEKLAATYSL